MNLRLATLVRTLAVPAIMATGLLAASFSTLAQSPPPRVGVRGAITAVTPTSLTVHTNRGEDMNIVLTEKTQVRGVTLAKIGDIKPGSYIGTAATPQADGSLKALEVTVFPPAMNGASEGHFPWDLTPTSTMTNGTVGDLVKADGHTLTVKYKGGEKKVVVPDDVPVVNLEGGDRTLLTVGTKVVLFATKGDDGKLTAGFISAGKNGVTPPM
jgi:RNase P/RNase MRP subunit p29